MAQIGYGYGSEFQLLRFLGRHRHKLDNAILSQLNEAGNIDWLDFNMGDRMHTITGDEEIKGLSFLYDKNVVNILGKSKVDDIMKKYRDYNINNIDNWQNWDSVFILNDTIYLVEAKANIKEFGDNKIHGGQSQNGIIRFMKEQLPDIAISEKTWLGKYYQFANRLATTAFLVNNGVKAKFIYLLFGNGYAKRKVNKNGKITKVIKTLDATESDFIDELNKEVETLGIDDAPSEIKNIFSGYVYIDAKK